MKGVIYANFPIRVSFCRDTYFIGICTVLGVCPMRLLPNGMTRSEKNLKEQDEQTVRYSFICSFHLDSKTLKTIFLECTYVSFRSAK
jgi:hypothetical protein